METGSDPTELALIAMIAPIAGAILTWVVVESIALVADDLTNRGAG
jgi:hypothetical protein